MEDTRSHPTPLQRTPRPAIRTGTGPSPAYSVLLLPAAQGINPANAFLPRGQSFPPDAGPDDTGTASQGSRSR